MVERVGRPEVSGKLPLRFQKGVIVKISFCVEAYGNRVVEHRHDCARVRVAAIERTRIGVVARRREGAFEVRDNALEPGYGGDGRVVCISFRFLDFKRARP